MDSFGNAAVRKTGLNTKNSPQPIRAEGLFLTLFLGCRLASRRGFEPLLPP